MNLAALSYELLTEAITKGTITLQNGTVYELNTSQLITITKFLIGNTLSTTIKDSQEENIPQEMLLPFTSLNTEEDLPSYITLCYRCHAQYPTHDEFYSSPDDPLAQVCSKCKEGK